MRAHEVHVSKCRVCRGPAVIDLPRHNANFCAEHLQQLCRRQVEKAIADHDMLAPGERVLVAVSGGKDSLAVWDLLIELGYEADGLYIGLGIGDYSDVSGRYARDFADARGLRLQHDRPARRARLRRADGRPGDPSRAVLGVRTVQAPPVRRRRARGRLRRRRHRPQPRRRGGRAARQHPALGHRLPGPPAAGAARRQRLPPQGQAAGAPDRAGDGGVVHRAGHRLPGRGVPDGGRQQAPRLQGGAEPARSALARDQGGVLPRLRRAHGAAARRSFAVPPSRDSAPCARCGSPTTGEVCAFCRLVEVAAAHEPVPVEMLTRSGRR